MTTPTRPTKAYVSMVITLAGFIGLHLTDGDAQAIVMAGQLIVIGYGVWRVPNKPKGRRVR
jgi:hypothetical protein